LATTLAAVNENVFEIFDSSQATLEYCFFLEKDWFAGNL